ncbi:MAG: hypothetical protein ACI83D_000075 [Planctomycetota bacterium]|jgi:hypothetical protein
MGTLIAIFVIIWLLMGGYYPPLFFDFPWEGNTDLKSTKFIQDLVDFTLGAE